jgi:hypothetical protein
MDYLSIIIQAGAVGISVLLIFLLWNIVKEYQKTVNNHLAHLDDTLNKLNETIGRVSVKHDNLASVLDKNTRMVQDNMGMMERLKGFINGKGK